MQQEESQRRQQELSEDIALKVGVVCHHDYNVDKKRRRLRRSTSSAMFSERCKALEDFLLELKRSVDFTRTMMVMLTQDDKDDDKND